MAGKFMTQEVMSRIKRSVAEMNSVKKRKKLKKARVMIYRCLEHCGGFAYLDEREEK